MRILLMNELSKSEIYALYQSTIDIHLTLDIGPFSNANTWDRHIETLQRIMKQITPLMMIDLMPDVNIGDIEYYAQAWGKLQKYYIVLKQAYFNHPEKCNAKITSAIVLFDEIVSSLLKREEEKIKQLQLRLCHIEFNLNLAQDAPKNHTLQMKIMRLSDNQRENHILFRTIYGILNSYLSDQDKVQTLKRFFPQPPIIYAKSPQYFFSTAQKPSNVEPEENKKTETKTSSNMTT